MRRWAADLGAVLTEVEEEASHVVVADTEGMAETTEFFCRQVRTLPYADVC